MVTDQSAQARWRDGRAEVCIGSRCLSVDARDSEKPGGLCPVELVAAALSS